MTNKLLTVGVDLGGTKIAFGALDQEGTLYHQEIIKTRVSDGPLAIVADVIAAVNRIKEKEPSCQFLGVGIGMAGQIEKQTGAVFFSTNLGWQNFPLQEMVAKEMQLPVYVLNDVRAAAFGEWVVGAGKGSKDILCVFVGTGIGGGVVSDSMLLEGDTNAAAEIGHFTIDLQGPKCTCGNTGCFEAFAGGWAIAKRAKELIRQNMSDGQDILKLVDGKVDALTTKHVFEAYRCGAALAKQVVEELTLALIAGTSGLVNIFNPERLILGGSICVGNSELIEAVHQGVLKKSLKISTRNLKIMAASLGNSAGVIGAAMYAKKKIEEGNKR